jgi:sterol desaturase/sphingolipid hydroxylase (fatty acid hydroxylase superfamily)
MHSFSSPGNLFDTLRQSVFLSVRFFLFAGAIFLFFYVWKKRKYWHLKIQQRFPDKKHIYREIRYSFYSVVIFGIVIAQVMWASRNHWTLIYHPIDKYGWPYYFFSIVLMIFVHDAYFYWTHRLLHWKPLYKTVHVVHHRSLNPTPFSAYAFHPVEALVESLIIPIVVFTIPYHVTTLYFFSAYTLLMNIFGHTGYEFFPKGFVRNRFWKWHNTATNHNMHHRFIKCNYGLYFNIWDRLMKTNHPKYEEMFEEVVAQRKLTRISDLNAAALAAEQEPAAEQNAG